MVKQMSKKYCDCKSRCGVNNSKAMYAVDYDNLIERLISARDEIDSLINLLEDRKAKDDVINSILSTEYEEEIEEKDDDTVILTEEEKELLRKILKGEAAKINTTVYTPKRYTLPWNKVPYTTWF